MLVNLGLHVCHASLGWVRYDFSAATVFQVGVRQRQQRA